MGITGILVWLAPPTLRGCGIFYQLVQDRTPSGIGKYIENLEINN